jgi:Ser/Thr protein kinase RdoA (MazF antagonist)
MFPAGLSMLWESTDPVDALRARFGPDGFDDAAGWLGACLARAWDVDVQACDRILISYRNAIAWVHTGREMLVAKWSCDRSRFATLSAVADLLRALDGQQVPVAPPLASVDGRHRVVVDSGPSPLSVMVQPCVDGDLLDVADLAAVRNAGACLASLHHALAAHRDDRPAAAAPVDLRQRVERWWERGGAGKAPIDGRPQLVHGDYRASNILTAGPEIRAVIDFDEVRWDHRITDVANAFVRLGTHFAGGPPRPRPVSTSWRGTGRCGRSPRSNTGGSTWSCSGTASGPSRRVMIRPDGRTPSSPAVPRPTA